MVDPISSASDPVETEAFKPELGKLMVRTLYDGDDNTTPTKTDIHFVDEIITTGDGNDLWHYEQIATQTGASPEIYFSSGTDTATGAKVVPWGEATRIEHRYASDEDLALLTQQLTEKYGPQRVEEWLNDVAETKGINPQDVERLRATTKKEA